jgi:hypothetical protein
VVPDVLAPEPDFFVGVEVPFFAGLANDFYYLIY